MPNHEDDDWLNAEPATSDEPRDLPPFGGGVWRIEAQGEDGQSFPSLIAALVEPPMTPEAEIRGPGGRLAECCPDTARWLPTTIGRERIEREAHGEVAA